MTLNEGAGGGTQAGADQHQGTVNGANGAVTTKDSPEPPTWAKDLIAKVEDLHGAHGKLKNDLIDLRKANTRRDAAGAKSNDGPKPGEGQKSEDGGTPTGPTREEIQAMLDEREARGEAKALLSQLSEDQREELGPMIEERSPAQQVLIIQSYLQGAKRMGRDGPTSRGGTPPRSGGRGEPPGDREGVPVPRFYEDWAAMKVEDRRKLSSAHPDFDSEKLPRRPRI